MTSADVKIKHFVNIMSCFKLVYPHFDFMRHFLSEFLSAFICIGAQ
jgi:hypothetical protein